MSDRLPKVWHDLLAEYLPEEPGSVLTLPLAEYRSLTEKIRETDPACQLLVLTVAQEGETVGLRLVLRSSRYELLVLRFDLGSEDELDAILLPTISDLFAAAVWHERETWDLWGLRFENHPDLRRILLPEEWQGHPLRKSYAIDTPCPPYRPLPEKTEEATVSANENAS